MYFNGTKCRLFILSCLTSFSLFAKDVKTFNPQGLQKPLCFVENKGQVLDQDNKPRTDIQFKMSTPGMSLYLGNGKLYYQFRKVVMGDKAPEINSYHMDVSLVGANPDAKVITTGKLGYYENYLSSDRSRDGFSANAYSKVCYKDVYPGIDWVLYVKEDKVEYDFVVHPGADPNDIKIKYEGATSLALTGNGSIRATTPFGTVEEKHPVAFETNTGHPVSSKFVLHDNIICFQTGSYKGSLTIDPFLSWASYFNNGTAAPTLEDVITCVKVAASGNIYIGGYTASTTGISLGGGVYQNAYQGGAYDAFMSKIGPTGTVTWTTYFGGSNSDQGYGVALGTGTSVYLVGTTTSASPTGGNNLAHLTNSGGSDIFAIKLNSGTGTRAGNWSLFYGGTGNETGTSAVCDATGNLYIGGSTASAGISTDATTLNGPMDGLLLKYSAAGALQWATYVGGNANDSITNINCDAANNIVITGITTSTANLASATAFQPAPGGSTDAFVGRYSSGGAQLWVSYFGGPGIDHANGIVTETAVPYNIYITGNTTSTTGIASPQSFQTSSGGGVDAFLAKIDVGGASVFWSTYLGGASTDDARAITFDGLNVTVAGITNSASGLPTGQGYQPAIGGGSDAFVAKFNAIGQNQYASYFGNANTDGANSIGFDPTSNNALLIVGYTSSAGGINTIGTGYGGGVSDGFLAKFAPDTLVSIRQTYTDTIICQGGTLIIHDTTNYNFRAGNVFTVQLSNATGSFAAPVTIGTSTAVSAGAIACTIPAGTPVGAGYRIRIVSSTPAFISPDDNKNIQVLAALPPQIVTTNAPVCLNQTIDLFEAAPYAVTSYSWTGPSAFTSTLQSPIRTVATTAFAGTYSVSVTHNGCPANVSTVNVIVNTLYPPAPFDSSSGPVCQGVNLNLYARPDTTGGTFTYYWTGPGGFTSTLQNPVITNVPATGAGTYWVIDTMGACPSVATPVTVVVTPLDTPKIVISAIPGDTVCYGQMVNFTSVVTNGGYSPTFQWLDGPTTPIVGAMSDYYSTSTFALGTAIRCVLYSSAACPTTLHDTSNIINMGVFNNTPLVTISASPGTYVAPNTTVTFNASVSGPSIVGYQWYINNVLISGATSTSLIVPHMTHNDTVRFEVTSNAICANIGVSNTLIVHVTTAVANVSPSFNNVELFPNPNNGFFSVKGLIDAPSADGDVNMEVVNALGQIVYSGHSTIQNSMLDASFNFSRIPAGVYMLRLNKDGEGKIFRFMIE